MHMNSYLWKTWMQLIWIKNQIMAYTVISTDSPSFRKIEILSAIISGGNEYHSWQKRQMYS